LEKRNISESDRSDILMEVWVKKGILNILLEIIHIVFYLKVINFNYGSRNKNPLENVAFYNVKNPSKIVSIEKEQVCWNIFKDWLKTFFC
jgi:hypothetical protein